MFFSPHLSRNAVPHICHQGGEDALGDGPAPHALCLSDELEAHCVVRAAAKVRPCLAPILPQYSTYLAPI